MMDLIELLRDRANDAGGDKLLEEAAAALEAEREDGVMQRFADMLLGVLNDTQDALGFTDEQKLCPNGSIEIVAAINELREDAERAMDGLRYAALVWVLSDEIEQSPEAVDSATRRMIRGGAEFRRSRPRAFQAIDQARGKGEVE